ncbi:MAG TPA: ATP-binding protein, partial [Candidatus Polarisedimenticolia bacterium]|nr:ATP-binding protein [Candidatus Polarisedimenticolia bacterium]
AKAVSCDSGKVLMKSEVALGLENAGWPVLLVNSSGAILRANPAAVEAFGTTLEGEMPLSAIWTSENGPMAEQFILQWDNSPSPPGPLKFCMKDGATRSFLTSVCTLTDGPEKLFVFQLLPNAPAPAPAAPIPAKEASAESLMQKQKLDCALQLARTVSLDFNNALTSILGHASLLLTKADAKHPFRGSLLEIEKSAARAAEIANDLGTFSRADKEPRAQQSARNLNSIVQRAVDVFENGDEGKKITWTLKLEKKPFAAKFDEAKIQQAFVKILENAVQAVKDKPTITVQSRNVELAQGTQDRDVKLAAGTYMCVEISDNGPGIPENVLPRIFEPFFTTKGGKHRGLGLAWVYGIVTNHGGGVAVSSKPGAGTSVRIYLPAEKRVVEDTRVNPNDLNGSQTVLMVDDEDLMLTLGQTVLSTFGYTVLTANSGQKALEIIEKGEKKVELVITDLVMPAMSGRELVEQLRKISPTMRVLCTSGYVPPPVKSEEAAYLQKPFTSQELLVKVKQVLTGKGGTTVD